MSEELKKYKINDYLNQLTVKEYRKAMQTIPKILGVSLNTFHNYRNILWNEAQDIPYEKVLILEKLFEVKNGKLFNNKVEVKKLRDFFTTETQVKHGAEL